MKGTKLGKGWESYYINSSLVLKLYLFISSVSHAHCKQYVYLTLLMKWEMEDDKKL